MTDNNNISNFLPKSETINTVVPSVRAGSIINGFEVVAYSHYRRNKIIWDVWCTTCQSYLQASTTALTGKKVQCVTCDITNALNRVVARSTKPRRVRSKNVVAYNCICDGKHRVVATPISKVCRCFSKFSDLID